MIKSAHEKKKSVLTQHKGALVRNIQWDTFGIVNNR